MRLDRGRATISASRRESRDARSQEAPRRYSVAVTVLGIAFAKAPASQSPNIRRRSHGDAASTYYAAMCLAYASVRRWHDDITLVLVTDGAVPPEFVPAFESLGVEVLQIDFAHRPPEGFFGLFNASLFSVDAVVEMSRRYPDEDLCLMDPDVLAMRPLDPLFADVRTSIGALPIPVPPEEEMNGLSALQAADLHRELDPTLAGPPEHFGGEVYTFRAETMGPVVERAEAAYALALDLHARDLPKFTTEEHLFNYALRRATVSRLDDRVRRIWTAPRFRELGHDPEHLVMWHLPAEKDRGFPGLVPVALDRESWFWTASGEEFRSRLGAAFGIPRRDVRRWSYDTAGAAVRRAQASWRSRREAARARRRSPS